MDAKHFFHWGSKGWVGHVFQALVLLISLLAVILPHGINPDIYVASRAGSDTKYPYPEWHYEWHRTYSIATTILLSLAGAAGNTRRKMSKTKTSQTPSRKIAKLAAATACALVFAGAALQSVGAYIIYSTKYGKDCYTGPGFWMVTLSIFATLV